MEDNQVKYTLILEGIDRLEHSMQSAKHHTDALHESMGHLKSMALELVGAYLGFEFLKESALEFNKVNVAVESLTQMYANNGKAVGATLEHIKDLAEQEERLTGIHVENSMAAEQNLMKYNDLKVSYDELIPLAGNLATVLHTDIADAANTLGRALENPLRASRLLMQTGASPEQIKMFQNLEKQGHAAQAQAYLVDILKDKYKGLAEAAFNADPMAQFDIALKEVKESLGELLVDGFKAILPYIKDFFGLITSSISWMKQHKEIMVDIGLALIGSTTAYIAYTIAQNASAIAAAYNTVTTFASMVATDGLSAALYAAGIAGTIMWGALTLGISLIIPLIYELQKRFSGVKEILYGIGFAAKEIFLGIKEGIEAAFDWSNAASHLKKMAEHFSNITAEFLRGQSVAHTDFLNEQTAALNKETAEKKNKSPLENMGAGKNKAGMGLAPELGSQADKVSGTKQVIINVSINKLVELIKIQAANIKEGANSAGEDVAKALLSAVDQFSASADI